MSYHLGRTPTYTEATLYLSNALGVFIVNTRDANTLFAKLKALSPQRLAQVEDFIDFVRSREVERGQTRSAAKVSNAISAKARDNEDDAEYDSL